MVNVTRIGGTGVCMQYAMGGNMKSNTSQGGFIYFINMIITLAFYAVEIFCVVRNNAGLQGVLTRWRRDP